MVEKNVNTEKIFQILKTLYLYCNNNEKGPLLVSFVASLCKYAGFDKYIKTPEQLKAYRYISEYIIELPKLLSEKDFIFLLENRDLALDVALQTKAGNDSQYLQSKEITSLFLSFANIKDSDKVYNPFSGLCSFELYSNAAVFDGEEINQSTWAVSIILLAIKGKQANISLGNSFESLNNKSEYDIVMFNPPYLNRYAEDNEYIAVKLALENKLKEDGKIVCLLPERFLNCKEGYPNELRSFLTDKGYDTLLISLPKKIQFQSPSTGDCLLVITKTSTHRLLLVDGTKYVKEKTTFNNILDNEALYRDIVNKKGTIMCETSWESTIGKHIIPTQYILEKKYIGSQFMPLGDFSMMELGLPYNEDMDTFHILASDLKDNPFDCSLDITNLEKAKSRRVYTITSGTLVFMKPTKKGFLIADLQVTEKCNLSWDNSIVAIRIIERTLLSETYLKCILKSEYVDYQLRNLWKGISVPKFLTKDIPFITIPIPSLQEQDNMVKKETSKWMKKKDRTIEESFRQYEKEIHCRKHALSQTLSGLSSLWKTLSIYRNNNNGVLDGKDVIGNNTKISVNEVWQKIENRMFEIQTQIEHLAEVEYNWGPVENVDVVDFIRRYISCHNNDRYAMVLEHFDDDSHWKESVKIPRNALTHIFDNIVSNAEEYGFTDGNRNDYCISFSALSDDYGELQIMISNNGNPLPKDIEKKDLFNYGISTALNRTSTASGNKHVHSGIGLYEVKQLLNKYGADVKITSFGKNGSDVTVIMTFSNFEKRYER